MDIWYIYMINNTYMILCHDDLIYINDGFELFSMSLTSWYVRVDSETNTFTGQSMAIIWKSFGEYLLINWGLFGGFLSSMDWADV